MKLLLILLLIANAHSRCAFQVKQDNRPYKTDREAFIVQGMNQCKEYNGQLGCCDSGNDNQHTKSYVEIDGVFSSLGGGCDICAINLKRFWCQYACAPNQADFMDIQDGYFPVPDPEKPDEIVMAQKLVVRVQAQTACDLYNSCKRNPFVSSVSAMSSPAGFLTFQGHNAVSQAAQYMTVKFSNNKSNSMYFGNDKNQTSGKALTDCGIVTSQKTIHGFKFLQNCTCNSCEASCKDDNGFVYTESSVLQDFNYVLVGTTWGFAILTATIVTMYRNKKSKQSPEDQIDGKKSS